MTTALLVDLVVQHMDRRGLSRRDLGRALASPNNAAKAFRRLDQFLNGERIIPDFVRRLAQVLEIPPDQLAVAWEAHHDLVSRARQEADQRRIENEMSRRGPHLWGLFPENYRPNLITVVGPEFFCLFRVPPQIVQLPEHEQMQEVGRLARLHYLEHRRCRLAAYEFRRSLDDVYRFSVEGDFLGRVDEMTYEPSCILTIGGRSIDTTSGLFG